MQGARAVADSPPPGATSLGSVGAPQSARDFARSVLETGDHRGLPFAIVDKQTASVVVYRRDGTLAGDSSALLGQTLGDHSSPGVGERAQSGRLNIGDSTTPAGRFDSEPGRNISGETIVWLDYADALAIHRLRPGSSMKERARRMASASPLDNRMTTGCVVVSEAFYAAVIHPILGSGRGVVYVMPEHSSWRAMWLGLMNRNL